MDEQRRAWHKLLHGKAPRPEPSQRPNVYALVSQLALLVREWAERRQDRHEVHISELMKETWRVR